MTWTSQYGVFLAEAVVDPVSGGAGWVGAGLLGLVLGWLMLKHLPDKDKQLKDMVDSRDQMAERIAAVHDRTVQVITVAFREEAKETRNEFRAALDKIVAKMESFSNGHDT